MTGAINGFAADELQLPFTKWAALADARRPRLTPQALKWLAAWSAWDLACSPMDDNERRMIRYGHCLGWFDRGASA